MEQHKVYSVKDADQFNAVDYSAVSDEVSTIVKQTMDMLPVFREDMIISYLKDHALKNSWIAANPSLATLVTSNNLATANIEALFEASRTNLVFRKQLEKFIKEMFQATISS